MRAQERKVQQWRSANSCVAGRDELIRTVSENPTVSWETDLGSWPESKEKRKDKKKLCFPESVFRSTWASHTMEALHVITWQRAC